MSRLSDVLIGMGDTADKVAQTLREAGIKGKKECANKCPIANYLVSKGFTNVSVGFMGSVAATYGKK